MPLEPDSPEAVADAIQGHRRMLPIGAHTKPRLSAPGEDTTLIGTRRLRGIVEYDPAEFTFTALAGTPVREIQERLAREGQYLPFDPVLAGAGSTLGGMVAAGLNGPGRVRFGGIRDFILAVQFADGRGQLLRAGAKVVKNAAGFDIPKFLVGSMGRFGVLTEITFKVFPRPVSTLTVMATVAAEELRQHLAEAMSARWEVDAVEYRVADRSLFVRIAGPAEAITALGDEICARWKCSAILPDQTSTSFWAQAAEFQWAEPAPVFVKVPITLAHLDPILRITREADVMIGGGGSVAWIALSRDALLPPLDAALKSIGLPGLVIRGAQAPLLIGARKEQAIETKVHAVFDPDDRFAPF